MAIYSLLVKIFLISSLIFVISHPISKGALLMHQRPKCVLYSVNVIPPFPTSNISGSFHPPGPAYLYHLSF